jgi:glucokinase
MSAERAPPRLVADLGGTHCRFALAFPDEPLEQGRTVDDPGFRSPADAASAYLSMLPAGSPRPVEAVFAVAAPVAGDLVRFTNRNWTFSVEETGRQLGLAQLRVINDFEAVAHALPALGPADCAKLGGGDAAAGAPMAAIGPGTGLGVAALLQAGGRRIALSSEAGHLSFAPQDETDLAVWRVLKARFGRVSAERLLSGPGLVNLHSALAIVRGVSAPQLAPADVTERGCAGRDPLCAEVLQRFSGLLGSYAGDIALAFAARGGVYLGGGIAPKLGFGFNAAAFREGFVAKGRLRPYLEPIPAYLIRLDGLPLLGAAEVEIEPATLRSG